MRYARVFSFAICFMAGLALSLLCAQTLQADEAPQALEGFSLDASVDKSLITIGEKITYRVRIVYPRGATLQTPDFVNQLGGFAVKDFGKAPPKKLSKGATQEEVWYQLDTYVTGSYVIPSSRIVAIDENGQPHELATPEIFIEVKSVLKDNELAEDIRDIKGALNVAYSMKQLLLMILGGLGMAGLAGAAIFGMWKWRSLRKTKEELPPYEWAMREITAIEQRGLLEKGEIKEYYFLITACLRAYLERRFQLKALEQTTEEFMEDLLRVDILSVAQKESLAKVLESCDIVKFAKYEPDQKESRDVMIAIRQFIESTKEEVLTDSMVQTGEKTP